ncbi:MAG TPA: lectin-like protein [Fimbriimonadaceae bacterium]|nr:lectin-like protein [Fimbriimonadaceae bacterium]
MIIGLLLCLSTFSQAITILTSAIYNGHTYDLLSNSNWTDAENFAVSIGGHLATISDASENQFVFNAFSTYDGIDRDLWIGLNDAAHEGTFVWTSGEVTSYFAWSPGQPDNSNGNEDYVHIQSHAFPNYAGRWNDLANSTSTAYSPLFGVVELNSVPEPGSFLTLGLGAIGVTFLGLSRKAAAQGGRTRKR